MARVRRAVSGGWLLGLIASTLAGLDPGAAAPATAAEVVDRASLKSFVLHGKARLEALESIIDVVTLHDTFEVEGTWKSGSIYLMLIARSGVVLLNAGDHDAENRSVLDVRDDRGLRIGRQMIDTAASGGGFVDYHRDHPRTCYVTEVLEHLPRQQNLILVGGYDPDLSTLPVVMPGLERPEVTAAEVVDRKSLKRFVEGGRRAYIGLLEKRRRDKSTQFEVLLQIASAFRREGGYWKSGSTYVFIVSAEGRVLFHGADPSVEGRKVLMDLEDIHGVRIFQELIAAAEGGGGFVQYHWDDPTVQGDEETGSPKVGYAVYLNPKSDQPLIMGSGYYYGKE